MREIKFRGKCLKSDTWIYGSLFNSIWRKSADGSRVCYIFPDNMLDDDNGGGDCWEDFAKVAEQYEVDPATVGQYTGLKDENGREIYEGDIIGRSDGSINGWEWPFKSEIKRNDEECGFNTPNWGDMDSTHYYNVLGNIHDNPDLPKTE